MSKISNNFKSTAISRKDLDKLRSVSTMLVSFKRPEALEILIAIDTGLRFSEINNLTWDDVDLLHNVFRVVTKIDTHEVSFSDEIGYSLLGLRKIQRQQNHAVGVSPEIPYVFKGLRNTRPTNQTMTIYISKILNSSDPIPFRYVRHAVQNKF